MSLAASIHNKLKTAEFDQVYRLFYMARGLGPPRPPEAVGKMLQILWISAFPETNHEFGVLGQKVGIVRKSEFSESRKSRTTCRPSSVLASHSFTFTKQTKFLCLIYKSLFKLLF